MLDLGLTVDLANVGQSDRIGFVVKSCQPQMEQQLIPDPISAHWPLLQKPAMPGIIILGYCQVAEPRFFPDAGKNGIPKGPYIHVGQLCLVAWLPGEKAPQLLHPRNSVGVVREKYGDKVTLITDFFQNFSPTPATPPS